MFAVTKKGTQMPPTRPSRPQTRQPALPAQNPPSRQQAPQRPRTVSQAQGTAVRALGDVVLSGEGLFLKAEELAQLTCFWITDVRHVERTKYGPQFRFRVKYVDEESNEVIERLITLPEGVTQRDELAEAFKADKSPVGPVFLESVGTESGNSVWLFVQYEGEGDESTLPF